MLNLTNDLAIYQSVSKECVVGGFLKTITWQEITIVKSTWVKTIPRFHITVAIAENVLFWKRFCYRYDISGIVALSSFLSSQNLEYLFYYYFCFITSWLVEHLWWSFLAKIISGWKWLSIFAKKHHHRYWKGS